MITLRTVQSLVKTLFGDRRVKFVRAETHLNMDAIAFIGTRVPRGLEGLIEPSKPCLVRVIVTGLELVVYSSRRKLKKALRRRVHDAIYAVFP